MPAPSASADTPTAESPQRPRSGLAIANAVEACGACDATDRAGWAGDHASNYQSSVPRQALVKSAIDISVFSTVASPPLKIGSSITRAISRTQTNIGQGIARSIQSLPRSEFTSTRYCDLPSSKNSTDFAVSDGRNSNPSPDAIHISAAATLVPPSLQSWQLRNNPREM